MKYKNFDSYKINEGSIMNTKNFGDFEMDHGECESSIFTIFPKYKFIMVTNRKICYVYSKSENRKKYNNVEEIIQNEGDISDYLITDTDNGKFILQQFSEKSNGVPVVDIYQIPTPEEDEKKKNKKNKYKGFKRKAWSYEHPEDDIDDDIIEDDTEVF